MNRKTLCPLPWMHLSTNTDTSVRVCCNTDHGGYILDEDGNRNFLSEKSNISEIMNQEAFKNIRRQMMAGERPQICTKCYTLEDAGVYSVRKIYLDVYGDLAEPLVNKTREDGSIDPEILYLDMSISNNCNIKCRMCNPGLSQLMAPEFEKMQRPYDPTFFMKAKNDWKLNDHYRKIFDQILPSLKKILMTGGEPFLADLNYYLLERAIELKVAHKITVSYHTNLTLLPEKLIRLWEHFETIEVHGSIEAFGPLNEYIRYPSRWTQVDKNLNKLAELRSRLPLWLEVHTCLQAYSLTRLPALLQYLLPFADRMPALPFLIWLDTPAFLKASILPMDIKKKALHDIYEFVDSKKDIYFTGDYSEFNSRMYSMIKGYEQLLLSAEDGELLPEFAQYTFDLDRLRGQNVFDHLPELRDALLGNFSNPSLQ